MTYKKNSKFYSIYKKQFRIKDTILKLITFITAFLVIITFLALILYIVVNGANSLSFNFVFDTQNGEKNGLLPIIINTIYTEVITILISTPIGIGTAVYLTEYKKTSKITNMINFLTNILASIPSILLGLFGFNIFCVALGLKPSIFVGCMSLIFCVLPNIISTSKDALLSVPVAYRQGALSLGASKFRVILNIVVPCAMPGIITSLILSAGKIIGESAALLMTVGTGVKMPKNILSHIFESGRTLTLHLYYTAGNASTKNYMEICFATATILILIIFILNCMSRFITKKIFKN